MTPVIPSELPRPGEHYCTECGRRLVAYPAHYCPECVTILTAQVAEFRAYMAQAGHLGSQEIANWRRIQRQVEEDKSCPTS